MIVFFFFKQKTSYEMRISDWSSDVCSSDLHVLATQTLWQKRPRTLRISVDGRLGAHVGAKDLILAVIARIGADGAAGHVVEYAGAVIRALPMEARMTVCNITIEAGGPAGPIATDAATFYWKPGRRSAPTGAARTETD